jgi:hypothetical protein
MQQPDRERATTLEHISPSRTTGVQVVAGVGFKPRRRCRQIYSLLWKLAVTRAVSHLSSLLGPHWTGRPKSGSNMRRLVDPRQRLRVAAMHTLGVHVEQHRNAVARPLRHLRWSPPLRSQVDTAACRRLYGTSISGEALQLSESQLVPALDRRLTHDLRPPRSSAGRFRPPRL